MADAIEAVEGRPESDPTGKLWPSGRVGSAEADDRAADSSCYLRMELVFAFAHDTVSVSDEGSIGLDLGGDAITEQLLTSAPADEEVCA